MKGRSSFFLDEKYGRMNRGNASAVRSIFEAFCMLNGLQEMG
jgi:hypothetical protein